MKTNPRRRPDLWDMPIPFIVEFIALYGTRKPAGHRNWLDGALDALAEKARAGQGILTLEQLAEFDHAAATGDRRRAFWGTRRNIDAACPARPSIEPGGPISARPG